MLTKMNNESWCVGLTFLGGSANASWWKAAVNDCGASLISQ
jgi:hypothetical protein